MGQTDVLVDPEQGVRDVADGKPAGRPDHTAQLLSGSAGRAGHGRERADRAGAHGHAGHAQVGHAAGADGVLGVRASPFWRRRVLGLCGGHRHPARKPSHGHVQDGTGLGPGDGGRSGAPRLGHNQPPGDGRVRVSHRAQLQPYSADHHGGREGRGHGQADVEGVREREQCTASKGSASSLTDGCGLLGALTL